MQFPFVGASYRARSQYFDAQRTVNMYTERGGPNSKSSVALIGTPGKRLWQTIGNGPIRGMIKFTETLAIVVSGNQVYKVTNGAVATLIGAIDGSATQAVMASNGLVVMCVTGLFGYVIDPTANTIQQFATGVFTGADRVDFINGYFVWNKPNTGQFQISSLYDTDVTVSGTDFATAEGSPDILISLLVDHLEIWLFGANTTEVWFNSQATFPFSRIQGAFIEQGCAAKYSPVKLDNSVFWLSSDDRGLGLVLRADGYIGKRVSNHALEYAMSQMERIDDAVGFSYQQEGHPFYVLNFPTGNQTWAYDVSTNEWCERAWRNPADNTLNVDRCYNQFAFAGKNLVGDREYGRVYELDLNYYYDNQDPIARIRECPYLAGQNYEWQFFHLLQIDVQVGDGLPISTSPVQYADVDAVTNAGNDSSVGVTLTGFDPLVTYPISLPTGLLYTGFSGWPTDVAVVPFPPPPPGEYWGNRVTVSGGPGPSGPLAPETSGEGNTQGWPDGETARAAFAGMNVTGYSQYTFWIYDPNPSDNRGGLSIQIGEEQETTPPQAMLQWSDDGGHTWSNEHWVSLGRIGEYTTRARWRRLGKSRNRTFRVTITDPIPICIIGATVSVSTGRPS